MNETLPKIEKAKGIEVGTETVENTSVAAMTEMATETATDKSTDRTDLSAGKRVYLPVMMRRQVFARSGGRCEYSVEGRRCTSCYALELDHVMPLAQGGSNHISNLRVLCKTHNLQHAMCKGVGLNRFTVPLRSYVKLHTPQG